MSSFLNNFPDDLYLSVAASTSTAQVRKGRVNTPQETGVVGGKAIRTADVAVRHLRERYDGKRKPALVLQFQNRSDHFYVRMGEAQITVGKWDINGYVARLEAKRPRWSRRKKRFVYRSVKIMQGAPHSSLYGAVRNLMTKPGWFLYEGEWRSAAWVFKSLVFLGLSDKDPQLPQQFVTGIRSGQNLHVSGTWIWDKDRLPEVRKPANIPFPSNEGKSRTPVLPDMRSSEAYIQDDPHHQVRKRVGAGFVDGKWVGAGWVIKAPVPHRFTNKDPNPLKIAGMRPSEGIDNYVPLTEWVKDERP